MIHTPDRWLSKAGLASRREVLEWIASRRLSLKGRPVTPERPVASPGSSSRLMILPPFYLDGIPLTPPPPVLLALNKPRGVMVTHHDPVGRPVIGDLLSGSPWNRETYGSIRPLGRLDQASAGLLLLTNYPDVFSEFINPLSQTIRSYRVQITPLLKDNDRALFISGKAGEGPGYGTIRVDPQRMAQKTEWIIVHLNEGRNREIRNFLGWYGYRVLHLIRISFGPYHLGDLLPGKLRDLTGQAEETGIRWIKWGKGT